AARRRLPRRQRSAIAAVVQAKYAACTADEKQVVIGGEARRVYRSAAVLNRVMLPRTATVAARIDKDIVLKQPRISGARALESERIRRALDLRTADVRRVMKEFSIGVGAVVVQATHDCRACRASACSIEP